MLLNHKTALVTGGSRGIGRGIVKAFAEQGAHVAFTYHSNQQSADELVQELSSHSDRTIKAYQSNASDFKQTQELVTRILDDFDGLDILVNNAGITKDNLLLRMEESDFDQVLEVNLKSVFNHTKATLRAFLKQRKGSIIHISSIIGLQGNAGQANYAASKAGIIGFSKSLAKELGSRNIRSNVIAPGFIETDMTSGLPEQATKALTDRIALKRAGKAIDVANATVFLASELSLYITGQVLVVDGGMN
ncbi:MAG: 3-oxoacyl-[acyl-carrier-protein] reductase [Flavobacteriaceae bacterium]|nr:3-oxoacyl-[acyl-carrier-protein] reductase [Flavobacteriaceae bacterium]MCY4268519.1 3-oxoacyl-[acyl-carrier-protein] reductase [Flavobacteriaceae bacterium]MCY4299497.1 3-oxoacyl-[acyl-carrier-protein] reductase [Flavobacteriaceae bacterium]